MGTLVMAVSHSMEGAMRQRVVSGTSVHWAKAALETGDAQAQSWHELNHEAVD